MSTDAFKDREHGFEAKFEHDQELEFKVQSRRDKLFGLWLAEEFGLNDAEAETYAKEVVASNFDKPGDDDMLGKVEADIAARGASFTRQALQTKLEAFAKDAHDELYGDYKP